MKRYDLWLAVVLSLTAGILLGVFFGRSLGDPHPAPVGSRVANDLSREPLPDGQSERIKTHEWLSRFTTAFADAPEHQPTPGLKEAIVEALQAREHFGDQARLLLLIEMMRKEDFPVAIELFRKSKSGALTSSSTGTGPPVWIAFWQRFGELDPASALTTALKHRDIAYPNREFLEKYLFAGMARNNPRAAADAFLAHSDLPNRNKAVEGVMREWIRIDPQAASEWAQQNLAGGILSSAFYAAGMGLAGAEDLSKANALARSVPEGVARSQVLLSTKHCIGRHPHLPPQQLLDFVATTRELGARDPQFESQMAKRCATHDPFMAANFFAAPLPDGQPNDYKELRTVLQSWIRQDAKAAESWAKGQQNTAHYEVITDEFARAGQTSAELPPVEVGR